MAVMIKRRTNDARFYVTKTRLEADLQIYTDERFKESWCKEEEGAELRLRNIQRSFDIYGYGEDCWDLHTGYLLKDLQLFDKLLQENKEHRTELRRWIRFREERKLSMEQAEEEEIELRKEIINKMMSMREMERRWATDATKRILNYSRTHRLKRNARRIGVICKGENLLTKKQIDEGRQHKRKREMVELVDDEVEEDEVEEEYSVYSDEDDQVVNRTVVKKSNKKVVKKTAKNNIKKSSVATRATKNCNNNNIKMIGTMVSNEQLSNQLLSSVVSEKQPSSNVTDSLVVNDRINDGLTDKKYWKGMVSAAEDIIEMQKQGVRMDKISKEDAMEKLIGIHEAQAKVYSAMNNKDLIGEGVVKLKELAEVQKAFELFLQ